MQARLNNHKELGVMKFVQEVVGVEPIVYLEKKIVYFLIQGGQSGKLKLKTYEENERYYQKDSLALSLYVYFHCLIML